MGNGTLEFETVLDLCRDQHRRIVLAVLASQQRSLTVQDLTKAIVKHNHHVALTESSAETHARIRTALHHGHLPKLESSGVVEYDPERELVHPTETFDRLQPVLSAVLDVDPGLVPPVEL